MKNYFKIATFCVLFSLNNNLLAQDTIQISINRTDFSNVAENLVKGELYVNDQLIGETYERMDLRIDAGIYPGKIRTFSKKKLAQGPFGQTGEVGDFLLEIGEVTWTDGEKRKHLLFHGGAKAEYSEGCIMLGAVPKDKDGKKYLPANHSLRKLRIAVYGNDFDLVKYDGKEKSIVISIVE